jgi:ABC-type transporter Mla subunit MlaD
MELRLVDNDLPEDERSEIEVQLADLRAERAEIRHRLEDLQRLHRKNARVVETINNLIQGANQGLSLSDELTISDYNTDKNANESTITIDHPLAENEM